MLQRFSILPDKLKQGFTNKVSSLPAMMRPKNTAAFPPNFVTSTLTKGVTAILPKGYIAKIAPVSKVAATV